MLEATSVSREENTRLKFDKWVDFGVRQFHVYPRPQGVSLKAYSKHFVSFIRFYSIIQLEVVWWMAASASQLT